MFQPAFFRRASLLLCAVAWSIAGAAADVIVFGPQVYTRGQGKPAAVTNTFRVTRPSGTYTMRVVNRGVSSAEISLNGRVVLSPSDFNGKQSSEPLTRSVTPRDGAN